MIATPASRIPDGGAALDADVDERSLVNAVRGDGPAPHAPQRRLVLVAPRDLVFGLLLRHLDARVPERAPRPGRSRADVGHRVLPLSASHSRDRAALTTTQRVQALDVDVRDMESRAPDVMIRILVVPARPTAVGASRVRRHRRALHALLALRFSCHPRAARCRVTLIVTLPCSRILPRAGIVTW